MFVIQLYYILRNYAILFNIVTLFGELNEE